MKVFITNPPIQYLNTTNFLLPNIAPVGILSLAGIADPISEVKIIDNSLKSYFPNSILKEAKKFKPDVIAISVHFPPDTISVCKIISKLKQILPECLIITGGPIPTFLPEPFLKAGAQIAVLGEGEITFKKLLINYKQDRSFKYSNINGIAYKNHKNEIIKTNYQKQITNLNELPFLPYNKLPAYPSVINKGRAASLETVRGCPFKCEFCSTPEFWKSLRFFSNERILEQLNIFKKQNISTVSFVDDIFAAKPKKYLNLLESIIKQNYKMNFFACIRADYLVKYKELASMLKKAGFYLVNVGFEQYDNKALLALGKSTSAEVNLEASKILRQNDILILGSHIFGAPEQSILKMNESVKIGIKNSDIFRLSMYSPQIGSPLFKKLKQKNISFDSSLSKQSFMHYNFNDERNPVKMQQLFFKSLLLYYLSPKTLISATGLKGRNKGILLRRAYFSAGMFSLFSSLRKLGINIL